MTTHIVVHNVLSMRSQSNPRSEMVSQALFGEYVNVLEVQGDYSLISTADGYEGWALGVHLACVRPDTTSDRKTVTEAFAQVLRTSERHGDAVTRLSMGSVVQVIESDVELTRIAMPAATSNADAAYVATASLSAPYACAGSQWPAIHYSACQLLGTPYLWGGTSAFGIDCSGFVQRVFGLAGIVLPRDAYLQAGCSLGERTSDTEICAAMDIVFFLGSDDPKQRGITHVGIARDSVSFYHASARTGVALSRFDDSRVKQEYRYMGGLRLTAWRGV